MTSTTLLAMQFAMEMGLDIDDLSTRTSKEMYAEWCAPASLIAHLAHGSDLHQQRLGHRYANLDFTHRTNPSFGMPAWFNPGFEYLRELSYSSVPTACEWCSLASGLTPRLLPSRQKDDCQPNFRKRVRPDPRKSCGPYHLPGELSSRSALRTASSDQPHPASDADTALREGAGSGVSSAQTGHSSHDRMLYDRLADSGQGQPDEAPGLNQQRDPTSRWLLVSESNPEASLQPLSTARQQTAASAGSGGSAAEAAVVREAPDGGGGGSGDAVARPRRLPGTDEGNHDTIAMVAIDAKGRIAAGASSNGANHKVRCR